MIINTGKDETNFFLDKSYISEKMGTQKLEWGDPIKRLRGENWGNLSTNNSLEEFCSKLKKMSRNWTKIWSEKFF